MLLSPWLSTASCRPRKLEAQFIARYSMSSVLNTSTMKSPPLEVCVTGSFGGGCVSRAAISGPGTAALRAFAAAPASCGLGGRRVGEGGGADERRAFQEIAAAGIEPMTAFGHDLLPGYAKRLRFLSFQPSRCQPGASRQGGGIPCLRVPGRSIVRYCLLIPTEAGWPGSLKRLPVSVTLVPSTFRIEISWSR